MGEPQRNENEEKRLQTLKNLKILDTGNELIYDLFVVICVNIFHTPMAAVSLVDTGRVWLKAGYGYDIKEANRATSLCGDAIQADQVFLVADTLKDPRFVDYPTVKCEPFVRFYAGIPLLSGEGYAIGSFCIEGKEPRTLADPEIEILKNLAKICEITINQRVIAAGLVNSGDSQKENTNEMQFFNAILNSSPDAILSQNLEGTILSWNRGAEQMFGYSKDEAVGKPINLIIPESSNDLEQLITKIKTGITVENYETTRKKKDGSEIAVSLNLAPIRKAAQEIVGAAALFHDTSALKEINKVVIAKTNELEQVNKILVERELKMMDLKKEIERLTHQK